MEIEFRPIDRSNWMECVRLSVTPEQREFVASNSFSLAQAAYEPDTYPLAIYSGDKMVGFIMYDYDPELGDWGLSRLMVDARYQRQGVGRVALKKLLPLVTEKLGHVQFSTSAEPTNAVAIALYESMGFVKDGRVSYGEVVLTLQL